MLGQQKGSHPLELFAGDFAFLDMDTTYRPVDCRFYDVLEASATQKKYTKIQYFTDLHEFYTVNSVVKDLQTEHHEEFMHLATGEKIRLDRLMSIDGVMNPAHAHLHEFSCDC